MNQREQKPQPSQPKKPTESDPKKQSGNDREDKNKERGRRQK